MTHNSFPTLLEDPWMSENNPDLQMILAPKQVHALGQISWRDWFALIAIGRLWRLGGHGVEEGEKKWSRRGLFAGQVEGVRDGLTYVDWVE